jgi:hypothetical protein
LKKTLILTEPEACVTCAANARCALSKRTRPPLCCAGPRGVAQNAVRSQGPGRARAQGAASPSIVRVRFVGSEVGEVQCAKYHMFIRKISNFCLCVFDCVVKRATQRGPRAGKSSYMHVLALCLVKIAKIFGSNHGHSYVCVSWDGHARCAAAHSPDKLHIS